MTTFSILEEGEFQRWRDHPLTQEFLELLRQRRDQLAGAWARGLNLSADRQAQAVLLGQLGEINFDVLKELAGLEPVGEVVSDDDSL